MKELKGFQKGINLGGWISQCGEDYTKKRYDTYIRKEDIQIIASYGVDHVRLPFDYNVVQNEDGTFQEEGFVYIDNCISWCKEYGLNVVLDLHKTCGFVFDNAAYCDFFTDSSLQEIFISLWKEMARRYGHLEGVIFELLNEVTEERMAEPWNEIIKKTVPEIRKIAPNIPIMVGGIYNSSIYGLTKMEAPCDENMIYTFHCYSPFIFTHQKAGWVEKMPKDFETTYPQKADVMMELSRTVFGSDFDSEFEGLGDKIVDKDYFIRMFAPAIEVAEKYEVPLYCGEYGVIDQADCESTLKWYQDMHAALVETGIARAAWTYKLMDFGITQKHCESIYKELITLL